jgi:hypothetical protein
MIFSFAPDRWKPPSMQRYFGKFRAGVLEHIDDAGMRTGCKDVEAEAGDLFRCSCAQPVTDGVGSERVNGLIGSASRDPLLALARVPCRRLASH